MTSPIEGLGSSGAGTTQVITSIDTTWTPPALNLTGHGAELQGYPTPGNLGFATDTTTFRVVTATGQFKFTDNTIQFPKGQTLTGEQLNDACTVIATIDSESAIQGDIYYWNLGKFTPLSTGTNGFVLTTVNNAPSWSNTVFSLGDGALIVSQQGTLIANNTSRNLQILRTGVTSSGNVYSGDLIFGNDAPTGTAVTTGMLLRLQSNSVDKVTVDQSGNLTIAGSITTQSSQSANTVFAAPNSSSGTPSFRLLAPADLPKATIATVGGIKVGRSLIVVSDGTLRVSSVDADQINSVAPSVIAPGLVAAQITSVNPSSLTGSGTVPLAGIPVGSVARYHQDTATVQSISNTTVTIVNYDTSDVDTDSRVTTGASWKFTALNTAKYTVSATAVLASAIWTGVGLVQLYLYKNGTLVSQLGQDTVQVANTDSFAVSGSDIISLAATDYIDIRIKHNQGGSVALVGDSAQNYVAISQII